MAASASPQPKTQNPVLIVTRFDKVSAWMIAIVLAVAIVAAWEIAVHFVNRPPLPEIPTKMELIELGGYEDGAIDETLNLESPADETEDPSLAEVESEEVEVEELLETVIDMANEAVEQTNEQLQLDAVNAGKPGSATGTGRRPLGVGGGQGGVPADQRWFFRYDNTITLDEYARQLDFFKIEFGVIQGKKLTYVKDFTKAKPTTRTVNSGENENRLYLIWQGGGRRAADLQLFKKAGINATGLPTFQFIPKELEQELFQLEQEFQNRPTEQIRRTYFAILKSGGGYRFVVTRQIHFR